MDHLHVLPGVWAWSCKETFSLTCVDFSGSPCQHRGSPFAEPLAGLVQGCPKLPLLLKFATCCCSISHMPNKQWQCMLDLCFTPISVHVPLVTEESITFVSEERGSTF